MTTFKHILATALVTISLAFVAGCQSIPLDGTNSNIGAYNYGEFQGLYNTHAPTVIKAAHDVIKQFGLVEVATTANKFGSDIIARDANDLKVQIKIEESNRLQTMISVRWGPGGDRDKSLQLYYAIEKALSGK